MRDWNRKWRDAFTWTRFRTRFFQRRQIKQQQQQQQQQQPCKGWIVAETLANLGHAGTVYGTVPWEFLQWNTTLSKQILMTWFQMNLDNLRAKESCTHILYLFCEVEVCFASSNMCCPIRTNAFHWYRRKKKLKFNDNESHHENQLNFTLVRSIACSDAAPPVWFVRCAPMRPFQKYTLVDHGARFVYLFQHTCQQVCCCIFSCNEWLRHNLKEQIPIWS